MFSWLRGFLLSTSSSPVVSCRSREKTRGGLTRPGEISWLADEEERGMEGREEEEEEQWDSEGR